MEQPDDYAVVIGVQEYPNYRPLAGSIKDAEDFADWLLNEKTGGGLLKENCHILRNPPDTAEIDMALEKIEIASQQAREQGRKPRRFYFYFSGHGQTDGPDLVNLCLNRFSYPRFSRVALSEKECWRTVVNCLGFGEVVVFLDCCRVRQVAAGGVPPGYNCPSSYAVKFDAGKTRTFKAFSSEYLNASYEATNGYFTAALLAALSGGAASQTGGVRPSKLREYLQVEVTRLALKDQRKQDARIPENDLNDASLFGSAVPSGQGHLTVRIAPGRVGPLVMVLPNGSEIPCSDLTQDWVLLLESGTHLLIDRGRTPPEEKPIHFKPKPEWEMTCVDF